MALRSYCRIGHLLAFTLLLLPTVVWGATTAEEAAAQSFVPLVGIPYIEGEKVATFGDYVNAFYYASISIAAFLAVIRIIFAGVKYMLSDIVSSKQDAKKDIRSALFGLLIVVGAVLILNTINTNLTNIRLFAGAPMPRMTGDPGSVAVDNCNITSGCLEGIPVCTTGETLTLNIGDTGTITYNCIPDEEAGGETLPPAEELPEGSQTQNIQYICEQALHPNGCLLRSDFTKGPAEATCNNLGNDGDSILYDDPIRLGWGICYYMP